MTQSEFEQKNTKMMNKYEELKDECKDFSKIRLYRNMIFVKCLIYLVNPICLWFLSIIAFMIPSAIFILAGATPLTPITVLIFLIVHMIYWKYAGEKDANEFIKDLDEHDLRLAYKALKDTKKEKFGKNK